jgi:hypothetical protein
MYIMAVLHNVKISGVKLSLKQAVKAYSEYPTFS